MLWKMRKQLADLLVNPKGWKLRDSAPPFPINILGDRDIENSWVAAHILPGVGHALDFGNGGSPLGLIAAMAGYDVTAIDLLDIDWMYEHPGLHFSRGDLLTHDFEKGSFDLIINCSTVEHVGLQGRYGVNQQINDGDLEAMAKLHELLTPGGKMILTIPVGQDAVFAPMCRVYGQKRLPLLLNGYDIEKESFWKKDETNRWVEDDRAAVLQINPEASANKPERVYYGLGCFVLRSLTVTG